MMRRKGELSPTAIDRSWPHQVAIPASAAANGGYKAMQEFCATLSLCPRGHAVFHEGEWFDIYCFADPDDANKFMQRFGGEHFDPRQRGKGSSWARWNK
jgi:hypothetical protein